MQVEIITIGNEVLTGRTLDTNFAFLARALEEASVQVGWHSTVGDTAERIAEALRRALERADGVVVTGGLGPTPDDITRKAVATVLGRPLQLDDEVLTRIRERGKRAGRKLPVSVESQALLPRGATVWPNPLGTAPGLLLLEDDKPVILLPGVPQEMESLATDFVVPYLRDRTGLAVESFTLRTAGVFESQLHERIAQLPQGWPGATLAYLPSYFGVDLRVTVTGSSPPQVRETAARAYAELKACVAPVIYAEGTRVIEEVVGAALVEKGWRIATAESCTGGLLARRITDVPGSSRYFERGFVTYSNASKMDLVGVSAADLEAHGAVSAAVAERLAEGAREQARVEMGVGITGIAGPDGGSEEKPVGLVFIGIASPGGRAVRKYRFGGTRKTIRERAAQTALDLMRRDLMGLPLDASLGE
jgi:competence/damage-inducible protein CinA-like protein